MIVKVTVEQKFEADIMLNISRIFMSCVPETITAQTLVANALTLSLYFTNNSFVLSETMHSLRTKFEADVILKYVTYTYVM